MSLLPWLDERLASWGSAEALVVHDRVYDYAALGAAIAAEDTTLDAAGVRAGDVVVLEADYALGSIALMLALARRGAIVAPLAPGALVEADHLVSLSEATWVAQHADDSQPVSLRSTGRTSEHPLYVELRARRSPGLVIFTSGSSGLPKAVVHDLAHVVAKHQRPRTSARTLSFLLFDHIGGFNTLIQTLASGGVLVIPGSHDPEVVAAAVARHRVELLPVTPTFLNLLLLSAAHERHDLSSLKVVSYGTEPMPPSTLERATEALPWARFHQLYGMSELGILRSKVREGDGLWLQLGGEGVDTRVVDGILHIKSPSSMLGYLNAPSPFSEDGWLITGDEVEVDGPWLRIKGRRSELINVGGQKVFPAEVEDIIARLDNIADVTVFGEPHPLMGRVVACRVNLNQPEDLRTLRIRLRKFCRENLAEFKVPVRVEVTDEPLYGARHKRLRTREP
jgi:acyl-CoA synthetase (AMP-forming)/AMP-acid ligase II